MTWLIRQIEHETFARNPLASTDVEIRFHPIMRVGNESSTVVAFQDAIRKFFPIYELRHIRGVAFQGNGDFSIQDGIEHHFSDIKKVNTIVLAQDLLRINSRKHRSHRDAIANYSLAMSALQAAFSEVSVFRLGVRYVNLIFKDQIERQLNEPGLEWRDLISEKFLINQTDIINLNQTNFMTEIRSAPKDAQGDLVLRYGLTQGAKEMSDHFRFDLDRFLFAEETISLELIPSLIETFVQDIFSMFTCVVGKKLDKWMRVDERELNL